MTTPPKALADMTPADYNPREITQEARDGLQKSLERFGDLSGVVYNAQTGNLVAAHQRREALLASGFDVGHIRWGKAFEGVQGEEREGWFELSTGARFRVRMVDWSESEEKLANVTANNPHVSGSFTDGLQDLLSGLDLEFEGLRIEELILPEIDLPEHTGSKEYGEEEFSNFNHQCPRCGFEFDEG